MESFFSVCQSGLEIFNLNSNSNFKAWVFMERSDQVWIIYVPQMPQKSPRAFNLERWLLSDHEGCMSKSISADRDKDSCVQREKASMRDRISISTWGPGMSVNNSSGHGKSPIISVIVNRGGVRKKRTNWMSRR